MKRHKSIVFGTVGFALIWMFGCTTGIRSGGWVSIMPEPGLQGWTIVDVPADGPLSSTPQWSVEPNTGVVRCSGKGGRDWLRCDKKAYADFILHVEWRFIRLADEKAKYNSGVFVRNAPDWSIWHQAQMGSDAGGYLFGNTPVNGEPTRFSTREQMKGNPLHPAGEWNTYDITCKGPRIALVVNGEPTTAFETCEVPNGYVGLEAENFEVEFRNLKIKEI